ncbi:hypothetical protein QVD17_39531 [Tagetes erecta]|uniref:Uncharacterized protein n=1 Tax=Tagetes erecta TaxID=13708 RepID=A0AAD8JNQ0_TARER|nr:hypothetical protein QVD17_39531 [Tagetes erecta]
MSREKGGGGRKPWFSDNNILEPAGGGGSLCWCRVESLALPHVLQISFLQFTIRVSNLEFASAAVHRF